MKTTAIIAIDGKQAIALPEEWQFAGGFVSLRKVGNAVVIEPIRSSQWPVGFFECIRIDDPAFARPWQGESPPAPELEQK